jgi:hypothetical protein
MDGKFDDFTMKNDKPSRVIHLGLLRRDWEASQTPITIPDSTIEEPLEVAVKE